MSNRAGEPLSLDRLDIISPDCYAQNGYPHREWSYLRRHTPVYFYDRPNVRPFWAITKHADIIQISREPEVFLNAPQLLIATRDVELSPQRKRVVHMIIQIVDAGNRTGIGQP